MTSFLFIWEAIGNDEEKCEKKPCSYAADGFSGVPVEPRGHLASRGLGGGGRELEFFPLFRVHFLEKGLETALGEGEEVGLVAALAELVGHLGRWVDEERGRKTTDTKSRADALVLGARGEELWGTSRLGRWRRRGIAGIGRV